jgi:muramidase (phage lysozyme)
MILTDKLIKYAVGAIAGALFIGGYMSVDTYNLQKTECEKDRFPPVCWTTKTPAMLVRMTTNVVSGAIAGVGVFFIVGFFPNFLKAGKRYGISGYVSQTILFISITLGGYILITSGIIRVGDELAEFITPKDSLTPEQREAVDKARIYVAPSEINVKAFLDMIAYGEGMTNEPDGGYKTIVGYQRFSSYRQHPNKCIYIRSIRDCSTAAGRYQFLNKTWYRLQSRLRLPDFSPESQDKAAIQLLKDGGILHLIQQGKIDQAIFKSSRIWASMPKSYNNRSYYSNQPAKRVQDLRAKYNQFVKEYQKK